MHEHYYIEVKACGKHTSKEAMLKLAKMIATQHPEVDVEMGSTTILTQPDKETC